MSLKATSWLSMLNADALSNSEFRVLFHLCDCHNPSDGCFPKQAYLLRMTGVSNGTLNNALGSIEEKGLIRRNRSIDPVTKRQRATRYILGFEIEKPQEPTPVSGDGNTPEPTPEFGVGAVSKNRGEPTPKKRGFRLQPVGDVEPVREPVTNPRAQNASQKTPVSGDAVATFWADQIRTGKHIPSTAISVAMAARMIALRLVEPNALRRLGIEC